MNTIQILKRIRTIRELRGFSQEYIAEHLGISQNTYSALESGQTSLSIERLISISQILNVALSELVNDSIIVSINHSNQTNVQPKNAVYNETPINNELQQLIIIMGEILKELNKKEP